MIYIYLIKFSIPTRTGKKVDLIIYVVFLSKNEYARERYRVTFLKEYGAAFPLAGGNQKRVVGCDSTNSNTTDADNEKAGYGHAKEDKNIPVVNTMSYVDEATGITIYCENFPGPVLDKSQIS